MLRESIGATWLYSLVIVFMLLFVGFLTLALSYSKSFKTKNEIISIIEKQEGVSTNTVEVINKYLTYNGYGTMGNCPSGESGWKGATSLEKSNLSPAKSNQKYYYCIRRQFVSNPTKNGRGSTNSQKVFYDVIIFYKFNLPVINTLTTFKVDGSTGDIMKTKDLFNG